MLWQQAHPEIAPFEGFDAFKADVLAVIDPDFRLFLKPGVAHEIRLEEIVWGGVKKDGIPALTNPKHIAAADATYLDAMTSWCSGSRSRATRAPIRCASSTGTRCSTM